MKKKLALTATIFIFTLVIWAGTTHAAPPSAYVTYSNQQAATVEVQVYFDSQNNVFNKVQYATGMTADGSDLDLGSDLTVNGTDPNKYITIANAAKYMNYYVRIADATVTEATYVRVFPVTTTSSPGREFNDYAHGNFRPDTSMCGGCHSTHSALKAQLLKKASYYELCMLCHSNANSQSKYDVEAGQVSVSGGTTKNSLAGPFKPALGAISLHNADDTGGTTAVDVPGSDVLGGKKLSLTCVSCHNGHGGTNDNYRLLKSRIYADDGKTLVNYNIDFDAYAVTASATSGEELFMVRGNSEFCAACHLDYDDGNAWVAGGVYGINVDAPGPGTARFRHPVSVGDVVYSVYYNYFTNPYYSAYPNPAYTTGTRDQSLDPTAGDLLPLQYNPYTEKAGLTHKRTTVVCLTCHFAHGSTKAFNVQDTVYDGKYMLRLDNYGVCESCHKK